MAAMVGVTASPRGYGQLPTLDSMVTSGAFEGSTTHKTTGGADDNGVIAFGQGSFLDQGARLVSRADASATATTFWGSGSVNVAANASVSGDLSTLGTFGRGTKVLGTSRQFENLTFSWLNGFDNTQPIQVSMKRIVAYTANAGSMSGITYSNGVFKLNVKDLAASGSATLAQSLYSSIATNSLTDPIDEISVSVLDGGLVQVFASLEVTAEAIAFAHAVNSRQGAVVQFAYALTLPQGVAVSSASNHDYSQLAAVPEPACLTLLALGGLVVGSRRRR